MTWVIYSLLAIGVVGVSDIFRKLASTIKDPFAANLYFQIGSISAAVALFLLFSRNPNVAQKQSVINALIGGILISTFSLISFKALATGPGASTVLPVLRIGGICATVLLSLFFLKERMSVQTLVGLLFSVLGIYLIFSQK